MTVTLDAIKQHIDLNNLTSTYESMDDLFLTLYCSDASRETKEFYLLYFFRKELTLLAEPLLPNKLDEKIQIIFYSLVIEFIDLNKDKLEECPSWTEYQKTEKEIVEEIKKNPGKYDPSGHGDYMGY